MGKCNGFNKATMRNKEKFYDVGNNPNKRGLKTMFFFDDIQINDTNTNEITAATETITEQSEQTQERTVETMAEQTDTEQTTNTETITEPSEKPVITCIDDLKTIAENSTLHILDRSISDYCNNEGNYSNELIDFLKYDLLEIATANKQKSLYNKQILPIIKRIQDYLTIEQDRNSEQAKTRPPFIDVSVTKDGEICENLNTTKLVQYVRDTDIYALIKANPENQFYVYDEKTGIYTLANNQQMNGIIKKHIEDYEPKFVKTNILTEVRNQLASDLNYTELEKFNSDENIIVGIDGVFDVNSGKHFAHSPTFFSTIQLPCNVFVKPKDRGTAPTFEKYIDDLTEGYQDRKDLLFEVLAATLSNVDCSKFKTCLFLFGAGDSGKSQYLKLAKMLVGEKNACIVDLYALVENEFAKAGLMNKRLTGYGDINFKRLKNTSLDFLKTMIGGDTINGDIKFMDRVEFVFKGMAVYGANKMPVVSDERKQEIYNRMIILPCNNVIPKEKQDGKLCEKMFAERDEIMKILYPYFKKVLNNNHFSEPQICIDTKKEYIETSNPVIVFINECCEKRLGKVQSGDMCTTGRMYDVFKEWYRQNYDKYDIPSQRKFKKEICSYLNVEYDKCETRTMDGRYYPLTLTRESRIEFKIQYGNDGSSFNPKNFNTAISDKKE